ncbi:UNVERIFIED_CONTAM: hypothetical protein FKN15_012568 [Acipenser sinensis]
MSRFTRTPSPSPEREYNSHSTSSSSSSSDTEHEAGREPKPSSRPPLSRALSAPALPLGSRYVSIRIESVGEESESDSESESEKEGKGVKNQPRVGKRKGRDEGGKRKKIKTKDSKLQVAPIDPKPANVHTKSPVLPSQAETEASGTATLPPSGQVAASQGIPSQPSQSLTQTLAHLAEEVFTNAPRERLGSTPSLTSSTSVAMTLFKRRASLQSILDPLPCMGKTRGPLEVLLDTALEDMGIPLDAVSQKSANSSNSTDGNSQRRLSVITPPTQDKADPHVPRGPEQVPPDLPCGELNSPNNSTYCAYKDGAFLDEAAVSTFSGVMGVANKPKPPRSKRRAKSRKSVPTSQS